MKTNILVVSSSFRQSKVAMNVLETIMGLENSSLTRTSTANFVKIEGSRLEIEARPLNSKMRGKWFDFIVVVNKQSMPEEHIEQLKTQTNNLMFL